MSKERELLKEIMSYFAKGDITIRKFENSSDVAETLHTAQELLTQPEQEPVAWMNDSGGCFLSDGNKYSENWIALYTAPPKREPLTGIEISQGFQTDDDATHPYSYWSGVDFAEKAHGIGVDDE